MTWLSNIVYALVSTDVEGAKYACAASLLVSAIVFGHLRQHMKNSKETLDLSQLYLVDDNDERVSCGFLNAVYVKRVSSSMKKEKKRAVVLLHGMWHSSWHFRGLQELLAAEGFDSYALELNSWLFKSMNAHVREVEQAIVSLKLCNPILVGHSQGGIILQQYMHTVDKSLPVSMQAGGVVLLGTAAIGNFRLMALTTFSLIKAAGLFNYALTGLAGHVPNIRTMKAYFTLQETERTTVTGKEISFRNLFSLVKSTPRDGWPTYVSHIFASLWAVRAPPQLDAPSLVVHFEHDRCYPVQHADWLVRTYGSELLVASGLAHCFVDKGWEDAFAEPLLRWLDNVC